MPDPDLIFESDMLKEIAHQLRRSADLAEAAQQERMKANEAAETANLIGFLVAVNAGKDAVSDVVLSRWLEDEIKCRLRL